MSAMLNDGRLLSKLREITRAPRESGWVEFKVNTFDPEKIAEYISGLANSASIDGQSHGFVIWGVDDSGVLVGTAIDPWSEKVGNEDVIPWLRRRIWPEHAAFEFRRLELEGRRLVVLMIDRAPNVPVRKGTEEFIRVGSYNKRMSTVPDLARRLWQSFDQTPFELRLALENVSADEVLRRLDVEEFARLIDSPIASDRESRMRMLDRHDFVVSDGNDSWSITNLGALTIARQLRDFPSLARKSVRFVRYRGTDPHEPIDAMDGTKGYLLGFDGLVGYIKGHLPRDPETYTPRRITGEHFPEIAVRELVANASFTRISMSPVQVR